MPITAVDKAGGGFGPEMLLNSPPPPQSSNFWLFAPIGYPATKS